MSSPDQARLAYTVHEVRSPVAALAAVAQALAGARADGEAVRKLVELALAACRGIERVLDDAVLDLEVLDGVDVARIARDATTAAALGGARVRLAAPTEVALISGDPVRLRQALDNLIGNAVLHGREGGEVTVRVESRDGGQTVLVSVSNDGDGIPPEEQARIFDPGVRLDREQPGSGLGLAVVRAVVDAHAGDVSVDSEPGAGATFTIALPAGRS